MCKQPSKRYRKSLEVADLSKPYSIVEAVKILATMAKAQFDETVALYASLGVDPKQSDQMVRGIVDLPHGSGKKVRILVFTEAPDQALAAGATYAGLEDFIKKIQEGWLDFDLAIATPGAMKTVRDVARVLGPRGLMPNPKSGTVTEDIPKAVKDFSAGRVEFKMSKTADLAVVIGKRSFSDEALCDNAKAAIDAIERVRPESLKGTYLKGLTLSSTMSPGVKLDLKAL